MGGWGVPVGAARRVPRRLFWPPRTGALVVVFSKGGGSEGKTKGVNRWAASSRFRRRMAIGSWVWESAVGFGGQRRGAGSVEAAAWADCGTGPRVSCSGSFVPREWGLRFTRYANEDGLCEYVCSSRTHTLWGHFWTEKILEIQKIPFQRRTEQAYA